MKTYILKCTWLSKCKSEYMDKKYGPGMRVFNLVAKQDNKARCTVCGDEKDLRNA